MTYFTLLDLTVMIFLSLFFNKLLLKLGSQMHTVTHTLSEARGGQVCYLAWASALKEASKWSQNASKLFWGLKGFEIIQKWPGPPLTSERAWVLPHSCSPQTLFHSQFIQSCWRTNPLRPNPSWQEKRCNGSACADYSLYFQKWNHLWDF